MRILRGKSNLEVSSKGFAWFVVGLVLATFLGGAARTILKSSKMHERIVAELKNRFPKHEFQIGATEVLLSRGIWPGLGLRLKGVTFTQEVCGKLSFVLTIPQMTLPLDLLSLVQGRARLNDIEIEGGGLHLDYHDCPSASASAERTSSPAGAGGKGKTAAAAGASHHVPRPILIPKVDWQNAAKYADGIELKNFAVTYEKSPTWKLLFTNAYLSLSDEVVAQAQVDVEKSLTFGTLAHPVEFDLRGDENVMQWNFRAEFKEGSVHVNGSLDVNNQAGLVKVNFRQVPVRDLMSEAYQVGFVDRELKLKTTWLSCSLKWEGRLQNYAEMPVSLRDCKVEGGYGRAELNQADLWLDDSEWFKVPAHIRVMQLQVLPLMEAMNRQVLPAVLPKLGVWSGVLDLTSGSIWNLDGHLTGAEIIFSSQSLLGKQTVDSLHTEVKSSGAKVSARIDEVKLHDGEFAGEIGFDLTHDWRDGTFRARIDKLQFSPSIQKLLVGGAIAPLKLEGRGALSAGELSQWSGGFVLPEVSGEGWRAEGLQIQSRVQGGTFHLEGLAKSAETDSAWRVYPQLRVILPTVPDRVGWRDLAAKVEIGKNGGFVHAAQVAALPSGSPWKLKGSWIRDGEFNGTLSVSGAAHRAQVFSLRGEKGGLTVEEAAGASR